MESFVVAVMIDDVSVCILRFCAGGGEKDGGGEKWGGGGKLDVGNIQDLLMFVGYGVKEVDTGFLYEGGE